MREGNAMIDNEALNNIEKLHQLQKDGVISAEEFERSKERLLFGSKPATRPTVAATGSTHSDVVPAREDWIGWATLPVRRYAQFHGRSSRREFWMFQLI